MKPIGVLLVDDHTIVRQGVRALLEGDDRIEVVGEAETGRQGLQMARELSPEIVLMDISMPTLNGLEAARQIVRELPGTKVIILSSYNDEEYVQMGMDIGVSGYLLKQAAADELVSAVKGAMQGSSIFSPSIMRRAKENFINGASSEAVRRKEKVHLTSRELEVLQLIAEGYANKQIAGELDISIKTVEKHRQRVMDKLNIHQTAGLTRYAIANKICESHTEGGALHC